LLVRGSGVTVSGTGNLTLGTGTLIAGNQTLTYAPSSNAVSVATLTLGANGLFITDRGDTATVSSAVSGGVNLTPAAKGPLAPSGNSGSTGTPTLIESVASVQSNNALGTTAGGTTVTAGAQLQVQGTGLNVAENLTLNGTGLVVGAGSDNTGA